MKGRIFLAGLIAFLALLFFFAVARFGYKETLAAFCVRTMPTPFYDVVCLTAGAESYRAGFDPMTANPADPGARPLNYPRIWHLLFYLGLNGSHTALLGWFFVGLFFVGVLLSADPESRRIAAYTALLLASPAVLLGLERGNTDLVAFFLLSFAAFLLRKRPLFTTVLLLFAVALKLFPVFALLCLIGVSPAQRRKATRIALGFLAVYFALTFLDLIDIYRGTPKARTIAYGVHVVAEYIAYKTGSDTAGLMLRIAAWCAVGIAAWRSYRARRTFGVTPTDTAGRKTAAFRIGAAVYIGTFLLGHNYDYRMMFLILCVPQLFEWAKDKSLGRAAMTVIVAQAVAVWSVFIYDRLYPRFTYGNLLAFFIDEAAAWTVFTGLVYLLARTIPTNPARTSRPICPARNRGSRSSSRC